MKAFKYRKYCAKSFFLRNQNQYYEKYLPWKNCPKTKKIHYSLHWAEIMLLFLHLHLFPTQATALNTHFSGQCLLFKILILSKMRHPIWNLPYSKLWRKPWQHQQKSEDKLEPTFSVKLCTVSPATICLHVMPTPSSDGPMGKTNATFMHFTVFLFTWTIMLFDWI